MDQQSVPKSNPWKLVMLGLRNWPTIAFCGLVFGGIGFVYARLLSDIYTTTSLIQIDTQARRPTGSLGEMADLFQTDARSETETELIQSRSVLSAVIDSLNLQPQARSTSLVRRILHKSGRLDLVKVRLPPRDPKSKSDPWTVVVVDTGKIVLRDSLKNVFLFAKKNEWTQKVIGHDTIGIQFKSLFAEPGEVFAVGNAPKTGLIQSMSMRLKVTERGRKTGILQLQFSANQPDLAQNILNAISATYISQNISIRSAEAHKSLEYLQQQMPIVRQHLDSLEEILKDYRFEKGTVDVGNEAQSFLREKSELEQQVLTLEQRRQELLRLYKEDHPAITSLDAQINRVKNVLAGTNKNAKSLPLTQQALIKITRDIDVNTALYTSLLNNIQQLQVIEGGEAGNARVVDYAERPERASGPSRKPIILGLLILGLAIGYGIPYIRFAMKGGVSDITYIEEQTAIPVLGQIPFSNSQLKRNKSTNGKQDILAINSPTDLSIEAIRSLRTGIDLTLLHQKNEILCVTGMAVGDGKSFVSSNLAALFAQLGKRVLLIDADLRKGNLASSFGVPSGTGLSEYLGGSSESDLPVRTTEIPNLYLISAGAFPSNPTALLSHARYDALLETCRKSFDLIIVDTPPLMLVSDAFFSMRKAISSLIVIESDAHKIEDIQECIRRIKLNKIENLGLILNKYDFSNSGFGFYTKYGKYN